MEFIEHLLGLGLQGTAFVGGKGKKPKHPRAKRPLTEWQKCVKKYGGVQNAQMHYHKKRMAGCHEKMRGGLDRDELHQILGLASPFLDVHNPSALEFLAHGQGMKKCPKGTRKHCMKYKEHKAPKAPKAHRAHRPLTEWQKLVQKYGVQEAKKHYRKRR